MLSASERSARFTTPTDFAITSAIPSPSSTAASSATQTPSGDSASSSAATCRARRVFPTPPAPVMVTRRCSRKGYRDVPDLGIPAYEAGQLDGKVARHGGAVERAQRGKLLGEAVGRQLEDHLGPPEVLEAVGPEIQEVSTTGSESWTSAIVEDDTRICPP